MRASFLPLPPVPPTRHAWFPFRLARWFGLFVGGSVLLARLVAQEASTSPTQDEFAARVKLAPFVVSGKSLAISIYARTGSDRRYGEQFSERVAKVVHESVTTETGKGLVIIGAKGEPHPAFVFRKFLALANEGKLHPAVAAHGAELTARLDSWRQSLRDKKSDDDDNDDDLGLDFDKIFVALPLPLGGIGAKLYQLAWEDKFDEAKVEATLRALGPQDMKRLDRFESFAWVFYLPPTGAFDRVLDDIIATALKKEEMGFAARAVVKGALLLVKPKIRRAIEAMRQGLMFRTVVQAQTPYSNEEVSALADAYVEAFMPFTKKEKQPPGRTEHERAVNAVREQLRKNAEKPEEFPAPNPSEPAKTAVVK